MVAPSFARPARCAAAFGVVLVALTEIVLALFIAGVVALACVRVPPQPPVDDPPVLEGTVGPIEISRGFDPAPRCIVDNGCEFPEGTP